MLSTLRRRLAAARDPVDSGDRDESADELKLLHRTRKRHVVNVGEPVVLVSQIARSGGTLLSQLFDGHPECHAHSQELHIGHPISRDWPVIDLNDPEHWFSKLDEEKPGKRLRKGYSKSLRGKAEVFPFCFLPSLQREIFEKCVARRAIECERDVLDCYFTSYFNAWLDNHNLYTGPKKVVTAFAPGMVTKRDQVDRFFSAYPDGTLISVVREPCGWFGSAHKWRPRRFADLDQALPVWRQGTEAVLEAVDRYRDRVVLLTFDQLALATERTMMQLADRIGIAMVPALLTPTFNSRPIRANSSDVVDRYGVLTERAIDYRQSLDAATRAHADELVGDLYERATALSLS